MKILFVSNTKRTCIRSDSTNNFISFEIIGNDSKARELGSIWTEAEKRWTPITCEMLFARHKRKSFLHRIVTSDEKWIHYDNPKKRKSWGPGHALTSTAKPNIHSGKKLMLCIWWNQLGVVLWVAQTERDHYWDSLPNTIDEIEQSTQGKTRPLLLQAW